MNKFIIRERDALRRENARRAIDALDPSKEWVVEIKQYRRKRSLDQNAFFWGVPIKILSEHTGHSPDDLKEYLLGEWSGWTEYEIEGRKFSKPAIPSTTKLDTLQFTRFLEFIEMWAASKLGISIPRPGEY